MDWFDRGHTGALVQIIHSGDWRAIFLDETTRSIQKPNWNLWMHEYYDTTGIGTITLDAALLLLGDKIVG